MRIYLVRHGESECNVLNMLYGRTDCALTDRGRGQAALVGEKLRGCAPFRCVSSPLLRAAETARIAAGIAGCGVEYDPRLMEQDMGEWENVPFFGLLDSGDERLRAMLREENLVVQEKEKRIYLNAVIPPVAEGADGRAVTLALSPLVERVLGRKWSATDEQIDWMDHLAQGRFESVSALYSAWRELLPVMEEDLKKGRLLSCVFRFLKRCGRRWWTKHKQARAQKRRAAEQNA